MDVDTLEWISPRGAPAPCDNQSDIVKCIYLHLSLLSAGNLTEAARCAGTHLYLSPGDQEMITNVEYYKQEGGVEDTRFTPRQEAVDYVHRKGVMEISN